MRKQKSGIIVNISSALGRFAITDAHEIMLGGIYIVYLAISRPMA